MLNPETTASTEAARVLSAGAEAHRDEVSAGARFEFGKNWAGFLRVLDEERIGHAETALAQMLERKTLVGLRFLDIGSGSGLSSLAARRLGATVVSFDYDPASLACTRELRRRYFPDDAAWHAEPGSALDEAYLGGLGTFDIVYSWGVLHHTGSMWRGLELAGQRVRPGGHLFIAIYNDQGNWSRRWARIKKFYCSGRLGRWLVTGTFIPFWVARNMVADLIWARNPVSRYRGYGKRRGMSVVHDWIDWLGGYPFEVAKPEEIFEFYRARGFQLTKLRSVAGSVGCNEFVFARGA